MFNYTFECYNEFNIMNYTRLLGSSDTPQGLQEKRQLSNGFTDPYEATLRMPMLKKVNWRTLWYLGSSPNPPIVSMPRV